jgi:hypothetical protein
MNKFYIIILFLISVVLKAEVTKLDSIFMELDHTEMHTKYLWDKQKRLIDPMFLSGNVNNDTLENKLNIFQLSDQFSYSNVTDTSDFLSFEEYYDLLRSYEDNDTLSFTILYAEYDKFVDSADAKGFVYWQNEQLYDSVGRVTNPYELHRCIASVFTRDSIGFADSNYTLNLKIPSELIQSYPPIDSILVNFNQGGGYQSINYNELIQESFTGFGDIDIIFKIYKDTAEFTSFKKVKTYNKFLGETGEDDYKKIRFPGPGTGTSGTPTYPLPGYDAVVFLSCPDNNTIKRPFIIVEGFDANNSLDHLDYEKYLKENANEMFKRLKENNYDIIFLNFESGGHLITYNYSLLEDLLNRLNNDAMLGDINIDLESNIRVMGVSMGGLVSRYCIAKMEQNINNLIDDEPHNVNMWFTVDSPHQGAYIPYGIRNTVGFHEKRLKSEMDVCSRQKHIASYNSATCPAAKQMLFPFGNAEPYEDKYDNPTEFYDFYNTDLAALDFPKTYFNFAITNGSLKAHHLKNEITGYGYVPYDKYIDHSSEVMVLKNNYPPVIGRGERTYKLRFLPDISYPPGNYLYSKLHFRGYAQFLSVEIRGSGTKHPETFYSTPSSLLYDNLPGGYRSTILEIRAALGCNPNHECNGKNYFTNYLYCNNDETLGYDKHCFIPTASSIDLRNPDMSIADSINWRYNIKYRLQNNILTTPFQRVYGLEQYNTPHALAYDPDLEPLPTNVQDSINVMIDKIFNYELAPLTLYQQDETIDIDVMKYLRDALYIEAVEKVEIGRNVTTEKDVDDFIVEQDGVVEVRAGQTIHLKDGTHFKSGSYVHLKIENVFDGCVTSTEKRAEIIPGEETSTNRSTGISIVPNPTGDVTTITISLTNSSNITLAVFDMLGNKIHEFTNNEYTQAGRHRFTFNATGIPNGMYYVNLTSPAGVLTEPLIIAK